MVWLIHAVLLHLLLWKPQLKTQSATKHIRVSLRVQIKQHPGTGFVLVWSHWVCVCVCLYDTSFGLVVMVAVKLKLSIPL